MYKVLGECIAYQDGRTVLSLAYAPSGRKREFLDKICGWMNNELQENESNNFSALAHKLSVRDELEDDIPDFEECYL